VIETAPGEEAQVDYGTGPMVRDPQTGKYRRTRLFHQRPKTNRNRAFLRWGRRPRTPGIYRFRARMAPCWGRLAPPRHSGPWVGARVASLRWVIILLTK